MQRIKKHSSSSNTLWEKKNQKLEKLEIRKLEFKCLDYNYNIMYKNKQSEPIRILDNKKS